MRFAVREGGADDIPAIMPVMAAAFDPAHGEAWSAPQCASALVLPATMLFIAEGAGSVLGFAMARMVLDEAELLLIAVKPVAQKRGIGAALLDQITRRLRNDGAVKLHLEMRADNNALGFYSARGFLPIGKRANYYRGVDGRLTDAVTLSRSLG